MGNLPSTFHGQLGLLEPMFNRMGIHFDGGYINQEHYHAMVWFLFWLSVVWFWPNTQQLMNRFEPALEEHVISEQKPLLPWMQKIQWRPSVRWAIVIGIIAAVTLLSLSRVSEFLYFQF